MGESGNSVNVSGNNLRKNISFTSSPFSYDLAHPDVKAWGEIAIRGAYQRNSVRNRMAWLLIGRTSTPSCGLVNIAMKR